MTNKRNRTKALQITALLCCTALAQAVSAKNLYRCIGDHGEPSYQELPCPNEERDMGSMAIAGAAPELSAAWDAPPNPGFDGQVVTINFRNVRLSAVIDILISESGKDLRLDPGADRMVSLRAVSLPWNDVLYRLSVHYDLNIEVVDGVLYIR